MSIRFHYDYKRVKISPKIVRSVWSASVNAWWDEAITAFARAAQDATHVDTGMSATSFAALVDYVGGVGTWISGCAPKPPYVDMSGVKYSHIDKSPEQGYAEGQKAFSIRYMNPTRSILSFVYDYHVFQLNRWGDSWGVAAAGNEAFKKSLKRGTTKIIYGLKRALKQATIVEVA